MKRLFTQFGRTPARSPRRREQLLTRIATELEIHSTIEEEIFYPAVSELRRGKGLVSEAKSEHREVDKLVAQAQGMDMDSPEVAVKVRQLRDAVLHHATEEEREMFPVAERELREELPSLGRELRERKTELARSRVQRAKRALKKTIRKVA